MSDQRENQVASYVPQAGATCPYPVTASAATPVATPYGVQTTAPVPFQAAAPVAVSYVVPAPAPVALPVASTVAVQPAMQVALPGAVSVPEPVPNCPIGLEYLLHVDQLLVKQGIEMAEVLTGWETANKYSILNTMGQKVFHAFETYEHGCSMYCCGNLREFTIVIQDTIGRQVVKFNRPFKCSCRCCLCYCPCGLQELMVEAGGVVVGHVRQRAGCKATFDILDAHEVKVLEVVGGVCICSCCADIPFEVRSADGTKIGDIIKQYGGYVQEAYTDADNFSISFPKDLDVRAKITLLACLFLVDFMFFESDSNGKSSSSRAVGPGRRIDRRMDRRMDRRQNRRQRRRGRR